MEVGSRCLEVGAGGGSIAVWLGERVAPGGYVLATDLDVAVLRERSHPVLEIREHDVLKDQLPEEDFDLVHLRLLLAWLATPDEALQRLRRALKPGGWIVAEEMDFVSVVPDPRLADPERDAFSHALAAHNAALAPAFDPLYGRRLVGDLVDAGFSDVACEGRASTWRGGEAGGRVYQLTFAQLRDPMIATGLVTVDELDTVMGLLEDPCFSFMSQVTMAAWGRRD